MNIHNEVYHRFSHVLKRVSAGEITWLCSSFHVEVNGGCSKVLRSTAVELQPRARIVLFFATAAELNGLLEKWKFSQGYELALLKLEANGQMD